MAKLDYTIRSIYNLINRYDLLKNYKFADASDDHIYRVPNGPGTYHQRSPWDTSAIVKVDADNAIRELTVREKFILLATVYEGNEGISTFCHWLDTKERPVNEEDMTRLRNEVLNKMVRLMNGGVERRGGSHGGGRKKNQKPKTSF